nr:mannosyl phosphorylinositol ceramide synthase csh1 [Quercus suber]
MYCILCHGVGELVQHDVTIMAEGSTTRPPHHPGVACPANSASAGGKAGGCSAGRFAGTIHRLPSTKHAFDVDRCLSCRIGAVLSVLWSVNPRADGTSPSFLPHKAALKFLIAAMRRGVLLFLLVNLAIIGLLVNSVWTLLTLLVVDGSEDAISKAELPAPGSDLIDTRPQLIPRIIHQTYKNTSIPQPWQSAQQSCMMLHQDPEWQYKLWTDETAASFIAKEYPWFLETFQGYEYPIQRADSIRYFVLAHYGGIYIDLDDGCNRALEPLLSYPAFLRRTIPTGISNDVMGAVPQHPFFMRVIEELENYDRSWVMPYISVMASTGPLFLSIIWRHWNDEGLNFGDGPDGGRVRILFPQEYNGHSWSFFTHHVGNSWHGKDVQLIFWMARNWVILTIIGFVVGFSVIFVGWQAYQSYVLVGSDVSCGDAPRWKTAAIRSRLPFWRRASAHKEYELVNRHEV